MRMRATALAIKGQFFCGSSHEIYLRMKSVAIFCLAAALLSATARARGASVLILLR